MLRHAIAVLEVGTELPAFHVDASVRIRAGHVRGKILMEEVSPEGEPVRCVAGGTGADRENLVGVRPI